MAPGHQIELRNCCKKKASNCQIGSVHQRQNPEKSVMRTSDVAPACPPKLQRGGARKELPTQPTQPRLQQKMLKLQPKKQKQPKLRKKKLRLSRKNLPNSWYNYSVNNKEFTVAVSIDQQFIEYIIKSVVGHPDEVKIERRIDEKGVLLELSVNPEDLGRVIGKRGATAQSLRTLLRALGTKNDARYNLKIIDTGPPPSYAKATEATPARAAEGVEAKVEKKVEKEEPAPITVDEPADQPVAASSDDIDVSEEEDLEKIEPKTEDHSDVISRTRKELADLDDLDV